MKIISLSTWLCKFFFMLAIKLSKPQRKNFLKISDALIFSEYDHNTISRLTTLFIDKPDKYALAGFFHSSTWNPDDLENGLQKAMIKQVIALVKKQNQKEITISIDDTIIEKYKDSTFELCDLLYDHAKHRFVKGIAIVTLTITVPGAASFTFGMQPYLSKHTIGLLSAKYPDSSYSFKTKNQLAQEMLQQVFDAIPGTIKKYVCFDSWYSSKETINFCIKNNATVICALKSNRVFDNRPVRTHFSRKRKKRTWAKKRARYHFSTRKCYTKQKAGWLKGINQRVKIIASRFSFKTKHPMFILCTDDSLGVQNILDRYAIRWECETDYYYLKTRLGLADFRVRSALAIKRYLCIIHFIDFFLQYRQMLKMRKKGKYISLSEIIKQHVAEHKEKTKRTILRNISNPKERKKVKALLAA